MSKVITKKIFISLKIVFFPGIWKWTEKYFEKAGIKRNKVRINAAKSFYNKFEQGGQYDLTPEDVIKLKQQGYKLKQIY